MTGHASEHLEARVNNLGALSRPKALALLVVVLDVNVVGGGAAPCFARVVGILAPSWHLATDSRSAKHILPSNITFFL